MIAYLLLGLAMVAGIVLIGRWFLASDPKVVAKVLIRFVIGAVLVVIGYLAISGRLAWVLGVLPLLLGWGMRALSRARLARQAASLGQGGGTGQTSDIETRYLRLSLDHDSGVTSGEILHGTYSGRNIDSLSMSELTDLLAVCRSDDPESARVLEAYLNRIYPEWWSRFGGGTAGAGSTGDEGDASAKGGSMPRGSMDVGEAYDILGLKPGCSAQDIKDAHRRLMGALHPDHGGSTYLASKLNQAKDLLLDR